ncbi:dihydropteroate synthase [uncultured Ferrovibrio sp.]|jgi:dihydropteroate synthase|uniref:dihydropteroate synthase n=1 Tax=uncultured Ferrovibrio sp. TaxID=1576913 RepID=UPI0026200E8C|nr:dihydropteroate synthase [uncultured Ferrovibrio sp.]
MGIVNVTDDSFSGDGLKGDPAAAIAQARAQVAAGADLIDLGAESTRPGAQPVSAEQEIARLLPVLEGLQDLGVPISVDTRRSTVMRAAAMAGAAILNDITALEGEGNLAAAAESGLPVILMHMQGEPGTMQQAPHYEDVVAEVYDYLARRIAACEAAGIPRAKIVVDPGFGFGKTLQHNIALMRGLQRFHDLGCAVLVGVSRKSMIGGLTGEAAPARRVPGSLAAALWAVEKGGAQIIRVHDVAETVQALKVWQGLSQELY